MSPTAALPVPPHPAIPAEPLPLLSYLRTVRRNPIEVWPDAAYEQDTLDRRLFGHRILMISNRDAIKQVLLDNADNYIRPPVSVRILAPLTGNGLLLSQGEEWRHQRRTTAPALAPRVLPMLARFMVAVAEETIARVAATAGQPVDMFAAMRLMALEIAGRSMFSLETAEYGGTILAQLAEYADRHSQAGLLDLILPESIPSPRDFSRRRHAKRWMGLMDRIIQGRMAVPPAEQARDLFDLLRAARDPETGEAFNHEQLRAQVTTLFLAGHATTAVTLFWSLLLLASSPADQQRVANEVQGRVIDADTAMTVLPKLTYTHAVINETLRLYPPAFILTRCALKADRIGDIAIAPGDVVTISPWVLHRHRRQWRDPNGFDPSRFLPDAPQPPRYTYMPFGAGPRICIGAQFALTEAVLVLARLVQSFHIERADDRPVMPVGRVTVVPSDPVPMFHLVKRT